MPNVMIIGFAGNAKRIRKQVEGVLKEIGEDYDAITTILPASTKWCMKNKGAPYLLVRNTKLRRARSIAQALHKKLNLDVEYEKIGGFIPSTSSC